MFGVAPGLRRRDNSFSGFLERNAILLSSLANIARRSAFLPLLENCFSPGKCYSLTSPSQNWTFLIMLSIARDTVRTAGLVHNSLPAAAPTSIDLPDYDGPEVDQPDMS